MTYKVQTTLEIKDNATKALNQLIGVVEKTDTAMKALQTTLHAITQGLTLLDTAANTSRTALRQLTGGLLGFDRSATAANQRMRTFANATVASNRHLQTMAGDLRRVEMQAMGTGAALSRMARSGRFGGFFGRGGGGAGHGGHGIGGAAGEFFAGAAMMGVPMFGGGIAATAGMATAATVGASVAQGMKAQHAERLLRSTGGFTPEQYKAAQQLAMQLSREIPTTTYMGNLGNIREMYGVFGTAPKALQAARQGTRWQALLDSLNEDMPKLKEDKAGLLQTIFKAAEKVGATQPEQVEQIASGIIRSYISTGGLSKPDVYNKTLTYMRSARYGKSQDFMFGVLPFFISEYASGKMGGLGQGGGIGPMFSQLDQLFGKGRMTHPMAEMMADMGLFQNIKAGKDSKGKTILIDTKTGKPMKMDTTTISTMVTSRLTDEAGFTENPFKWITTTYKTAMLKHAHLTEADWARLNQSQRTQLINRSTPGMNKLAQDPLMNMLINEELISRHVRTFQQVPELRELENKTMEDTAMKLKAVNTQFDNLLTNIGKMPAVIGPVNQALDGLINILRGVKSPLGEWKQTGAAWGRFTADFTKTGSVWDIATHGIVVAWNAVQPVLDGFLAMLIRVGNWINSLPKMPWDTGEPGTGDPRNIMFKPPPVGGKLLPPPPAGFKRYSGHGGFNVPPPWGGLLSPPPPTMDLAAHPLLGRLHSRPMIVNHFDYHQHGPIYGMAEADRHLTNKMAEAATKSAMKHQATTSTAGGSFNTPALGGSSP